MLDSESKTPNLVFHLPSYSYSELHIKRNHNASNPYINSLKRLRYYKNHNKEKKELSLVLSNEVRNPPSIPDSNLRFGYYETTFGSLYPLEDSSHNRHVNSVSYHGF